MEGEKKEDPPQINLRVLGQDNSVLQFKIRLNTPLRKLMFAYCQRTGLSLHLIRFRFDGVAIAFNDTAASLEMEDNDTIEVFYEQTGGGTPLT